MNMETLIEILLVEDNPRDAELTLRALKKRNLTNTVMWVKDGAEALEYILGENADAQRVNQHPKVILLDLKLPRVDGMEVLRRLKADERTKSIPVVVLTSSREEQDIVQTYGLGVNSYIVKPVDFDNFSEAVGQMGLYWLLLNQPPEPVSAAA
ncbi:MAG: response regulator [Fimbriimonas ginsengisoli]|uniref:Response regulator n=1 Tax=Fimbriimonas ginsengisoli TaxID=1005039 RepID=A0A931M1E3_FIMGI|nr:response regulator [Fimbriimonas ginsengisoli]